MSLSVTIALAVRLVGARATRWPAGHVCLPRLDVATDPNVTRCPTHLSDTVDGGTEMHGQRHGTRICVAPVVAVLPSPDGVQVQVLSIDREPVSVDERSDHVLARRAALGDRTAFAEIFARHAAALYRLAVRMLDGDHQAAEDAVQEALTKAWLQIDGFRGDASLRTWLFRLTANECHNSRRRRRPIPIDDDLITALTPDSAPSAEDAMGGRSLLEALDLALRELPWRQRATWLLREVEGLSYDEIATALSTTSTVVRGQLHRARATLAVRMARWR